jgi:hypothetical protein
MVCPSKILSGSSNDVLNSNSDSYANGGGCIETQPTEATLQTCEESGTDFAQEVRKSILKQKRSSGSSQYAAASNVEQVLPSFITNQQNFLKDMKALTIFEFDFFIF